MNEKSEYRKFVVPAGHQRTIDPKYETECFIVQKKYCTEGWVNCMTVTEFNQCGAIIENSMWYRSSPNETFLLKRGEIQPMEVITMDPEEQWEGGEAYEMEWEKDVYWATFTMTVMNRLHRVTCATQTWGLLDLYFATEKQMEDWWYDQVDDTPIEQLWVGMHDEVIDGIVVYCGITQVPNCMIPSPWWPDKMWVGIND